MRPSSRASSISLVNRPLPPISSSRRSWMRSPVVTIEDQRGDRRRYRRHRRQPSACGDAGLHQAGLGERQLGAARADADGLPGHCRDGYLQGRNSPSLLQERREPRNRMTTLTKSALTILGLETSCDETAASVVRRDEDGRVEVLSSIVGSQFAQHAPFGGVVPEIAARAHVEAIDAVAAEAMGAAGGRLRRPGRRGRHGRAGPGGRGDGRPVVRQGGGPGPRPAAGGGEPPGRPRGLGPAGRVDRLSLPAAAGLRRPLPAAAAWTGSAPARGWAPPSTTRPARPSTRSPRAWACPIPAARPWRS